MFVAEVFLGRGLQVFSMPRDIRTKEDLSDLLHQYLDPNITQSIEEIQVINPAEFEAAGSEQRALAAIKFTIPKPVERILSMGELISVGRLDGFELRRCKLTLGDRELVLDGIVGVPVELDDATAPPTIAPPVSLGNGKGNPSEGSSANRVVRQPENERMKSATPIPVKSHERSGPKVDMTMNFILVFSSSGGGPSKSYDLRPYVVAQILRGHVVPASIAMLPLKKNVRKNCDNHRVLLEVYEQDVDTLISVFNGIIVELASPGIRHGKEEMVAEARFRVFVNVSPEFKGVMDRRRKNPGDCGEVYEPARVHPDGYVFKRVWMNDPLSEYTQPKLRVAARGGDGGSQHSDSQSGREHWDRPRNIQNLSVVSERDRPSSREPQSKRFRTDGPAVPQVPVQQHEGSKGHAPREKSPTHHHSYANPQLQTHVVESSAVARTVGVAQSEELPVNEPVDTSEPLPPGWRAVYSHQYKRVYYAFKCPETGKESSSWTIPTRSA